MIQKKITHYFLIVGILICALSCQKIEQKVVEKTEQKKERKIDNIVFSYSHSRRIPFSLVTICISKTAKNDDAFIDVLCKPMNNDREWRYSNIDTSFYIGLQTFDSLARMTASLEKINLDSAYVRGKDGYSCSISFGAKGKNTSYSFWSPDYKTSKRGLTEFTTLCEEIVKVAKLNKHDILD